MGVPVEDRFTFIAKLVQHIDWEKISPRDLAYGVSHAEMAGEELTGFIMNGCRLHADYYFATMPGVSIQIPGLPAQSMLDDIRAQWSHITHIERSTAPEVPLTLKLGTVFPPNEGTAELSGYEYERRLWSRRPFLLGYQQAVWLLKHMDTATFKALGHAAIDFLGTIVGDVSGTSYFPSIYRDGSRLQIFWSSLRGAVSRKSLAAFGS